MFKTNRLKKSPKQSTLTNFTTISKSKKLKKTTTKRRFSTTNRKLIKKPSLTSLQTAKFSLTTTNTTDSVESKTISKDGQVGDGQNSDEQSEILRLRQDSPYNFQLHEKRWNIHWNISKPSKYSNPDNYNPKIEKIDSTALSNSERPSFYSLSMFPYPSGDLHMGHVRVYTISDCLSRYYTAKGFNVIHPMGWDAFGLPAENAARDRGISPSTWTYSNLKHMRKQLDTLGMKFDWGREVATCSSDYYKWTQWTFITLYRMGLAYRKKAIVNWDPIDETVLANEQVDAEGKSWRSGAVVQRKELAQWFFKITDYADDLLNGLDSLDEWPQTVKTMQSQWIGKKNSAHINFGLNDENYTAFTTRPDTLMGVTYIAVLPGHEQFNKHLNKLKIKIQNGENLFTSNKKKITIDWIDECLSFSNGYDGRKIDFSTNTRVITSKHRGTAQQKQGADESTVITSGFETPIEFSHPISGKKIPVFMADYVEKGRGTGIVMGVPGHDYNDFAFAKQHKIPVKVVISASKEINSKAQKQQDNIDSNGFVNDLSLYTPHVTQTGILINSNIKNLLNNGQNDENNNDNDDDDLNDIEAVDASKKIITKLIKKQKGKSAPSYQLHDWLVSRQRYWGTPIPIIYCNDGCGPQPVPEADLPVSLPEGIPLDVKGRSPLASNHPTAIKWRTEVNCPCCGSDNAERETDTLDTFIDSSWYFLRFLSSETHRNNEKLTDHITYQSKFQNISKEINKKNKKILNQINELHNPENNIGKNIGLNVYESVLDQESKQLPQLPWNMKELGSLYPVTQYIGGIEHAILHLLYSRFISYALYDAGLVTSKEPFRSLLTQGMVHGESFKSPLTNRFLRRENVIIEKNSQGISKAFEKQINETTNEIIKGEELNIVWEKMSKSKGNGVNPDDMVAKYGADVCRMFMLFKAPPEKVLDWDEQSVQGMSRWVNRLNVLTNAFVEASKLNIEQNNNNGDHNDQNNNQIQKNNKNDKKNIKKAINYDLDETLGKSNKDHGIIIMESQLGRKMTKNEEDLMSTTAITIKEVTKAMESRQFNVAIAKLMTLSNEIFNFSNDTTTSETSSTEWILNSKKILSPVYRESLTILFRLLHPIAPHFTSESFLRIQHAYTGVEYSPESFSESPIDSRDDLVNSADSVADSVDISQSSPTNSQIQGTSSSSTPTTHTHTTTTTTTPRKQPVSPSPSETHDISTLSWPNWDMSWAEQKATGTIQLNGKLLFTLDTPRDIFDQPDTEILNELCKIDEFKNILRTKIPIGKSQIIDNFISTNSFNDIDSKTLSSGFKRVVAKSTPKVNRFLVNFVM